MASTNYFNAVNHSGTSLSVTVDGNPITIANDGGQSPGHTFQSGENITATINGTSVKLSLPSGASSWSTLVFTDLGVVNVFPSAANQGTVPY